MRDMLRTRKQLVREQASHVQRIQKTLEDANLKLASVLTDIMGQSGRAVLAALAAGETDPDRLAGLVGPRVKASPEAIRAALTGRPGPHHRFLRGLHLGQIDALAAAIDAIDAEVERDLGPFREAVALLATIPGVGELTAEVILSEIGLDMSRFPSAGHLVSWAGLCPRNDESADGTFYADPGADHFRKTDPANRARALARQIERLGFTCSISPAEPVSI
jgi:transposase